jgi:hypothetical protein
VLSPEDFGKNQYLGYSVENTCMKVPYIPSKLRYGSLTKANALEMQQQHRSLNSPLSISKADSIVERDRRVAYILAKKLSYLAPQLNKDGTVGKRPAFGEEQFIAAYKNSTFDTRWDPRTIVKPYPLQTTLPCLKTIIRYIQSYFQEF